MTGSQIYAYQALTTFKKAFNQRPGMVNQRYGLTAHLPGRLAKTERRFATSLLRAFMDTVGYPVSTVSFTTTSVTVTAVHKIPALEIVKKAFAHVGTPELEKTPVTVQFPLPIGHKEVREINAWLEERYRSLGLVQVSPGRKSITVRLTVPKALYRNR